MKEQKIPERTVERLSVYRRTLLRNVNEGVTHVYSHVLASIHGITAVQVRRDLMLIGFTSDTKKGYNVKELIDFIGKILDTEEPSNVAIIGMGNLGSAITSYFNGKRSKLKIVAAFDKNPKKINNDIASIPCYSIDTFVDKVKELNISIAMLTLPSKELSSIVDLIKQSDIKGVLNFTSKPLTDLENSKIYVEDYDIITILEKVAYFSK